MSARCGAEIFPLVQLAHSLVLYCRAFFAWLKGGESSFYVLFLAGNCFRHPTCELCLIQRSCLGLVSDHAAWEA